MNGRVVTAIVSLGVAYAATVFAGVSPTPLNPPGAVLGPAQATNVIDPGDNHGGVGRTYIVQKANATPNAVGGFTFTNRSTGQVSTYSDSQFWNVPGPNGTTFAPGGDGRIVYDPYGPTGCATGGGRWIAVERGTLCDSGCAHLTNTMVVGVSTGENPLPSSPVTQNWTIQYYPSPNTNPPPKEAVMDEPR